MLKFAAFKAQDIEGFLTQQEGKLLYGAALKAKKGIVEIGSFKGRSSIFLAQGIVDGGRDIKLHCVDTFQDCFTCNGNFLAEFDKNTAEYKDTIVKHIGYSYDIKKTFKEPYDLLFIDGNHLQWHIWNDWICWASGMKTGRVFLHDVGMRGPDNLHKVLKSHGYKADRYRNIGWINI
jgi:predicted O-methyltransferase YrrM